MKTLLKFSTLILALLSSNGYTQSSCNFSNEIFNTYLCLENYSGYSSSMRTQSIVSEILNKVGISDANFILKTCKDTKNATAVFWKNKRYIIIDEYYLDSLSENDQYWFYLFVLSHEIGHHLYGHMFERSSLEDSRNEELQADTFAGFMIKKFGGTPAQIKKALQSVSHPKLNNSTHPIFVDRLNAAHRGYSTAVEEDLKILDSYNVITKKEYIEHQRAKKISKARVKASEYILNKLSSTLDEAIGLYNIAIVGNESYDLYSELSSLYALKKDFYNAELYIQKAYAINPKPEYLILAWDYCSESHRANCSKHSSLVEKINYSNITNPKILKILARYFGESLNNNKLNLAEELLNSAKAGLAYQKRLAHEDALLLVDVLSDLSVTQLRQEKLHDAYENINKAILLRESINSSIDFTSLSEIDLLNYSHLYYNKALIEMRLELWESCIRSSNKLTQLNPNYNNILNGDVYYFKGRSFHSLNQYHDALSNYNQAIKLALHDFGYLYYYRGLTHLAIGNVKEACNDLRVACDKGVKASCNRYKNLCNN